MPSATRREDLAWAAGFFDGEGHIGAHTCNGKRKPQLRLSVVQKDREPLDRWRAVFPWMVLGVKKNDPYGDQWQLQIGSFEKVQATIAMMWPFLTEMKRRQAANALRKYHDARQDRTRHRLAA